MTSPSKAAPDGGWGWVVVGCSFVIHMLTIGISFALSVLYVSWLEEFEASRGVTSWIISFAVAVLFTLGPVTASLIARFGHRTVAIVGGLMSCAGFIFSSFATNVVMVVLGIGAITGAGMGLSYLPAIAMVGLYFNQRRSLAMGLGAAGAGIGVFILAPLFHTLVEEYGWRGTLLITGGLSLNMCVCGALMRPLPPSDDDEDAEDEDEYEKKLKGDDLNYEIQIGESEKQPADSNGAVVNGDIEINPDETEASPLVASTDHNTNSPAKSTIPSHLKTEKRPNMAGSLQLLHVSNSHSREPLARQFSSARELRSTIDSDLDSANKHKHSAYIAGNIRKSDLLMSGSMHSLLLMTDKMKSASHKSIAKSHHSIDNVHKHKTDNGDVIEKCDSENFPRRKCSTLMSTFALLKKPVIFMMSLSTILANLSYLMPVLYMVDRAVANNIDKSTAAIIVSMNGVGNLFGRIFFGFLADRTFVDPLVCYIFCLSMCGAATTVSPVCGGSVILHAAYAVTFGCFIGAYCTMVPVVTVHLVGVKVIEEAYGLLMMFMGLAGVAGPPLAGWIFDWTGSYVTSFIVHGIFLIISGVMLLPVVYLRKCGKKDKTVSRL